MATGLSTTDAHAYLNGLDGTYIQLHTGDPGASGTSNVAGNATRKQISLAAASNGAVTTDAALEWTTEEVDTTEDYTHFSLWSASTSGTFHLSGTITANSVTEGDEFTIPAGDLDISLDTAS